MHGAMMFKQTQTPFDVPGNWPGVEGGGWLSKLARYAGATVHSPSGEMVCECSLSDTWMDFYHIQVSRYGAIYRLNITYAFRVIQVNNT